MNFQPNEDPPHIVCGGQGRHPKDVIGNAVIILTVAATVGIGLIVWLAVVMGQLISSQWLVSLILIFVALISYWLGRLRQHHINKMALRLTKDKNTQNHHLKIYT